MILWGLNPKTDDAPPLEFTLILDDKPPLPTCNRNDENIWEDKVLPLTRANYFLNSITSFAGLVKHFNWSGLTLYYTLTRAGPDSETSREGKEGSMQPRGSPNDRVLYITIFDHTERTARVFTQDGTSNLFYSATVPVVDLERGLLETQLGEKINSNNDPIAGDDHIRALLVDHYEALLRAISRNEGRNRVYRIENPWTMKASDVPPAPDNEAGLGDRSDSCLERDHQYFKRGRYERMRESLDEKRGEWVETYMRMATEVTRDFLEGENALIRKMDDDEERVTPSGAEERANIESDGKKADMDKLKESNIMLIEERFRMEMLLFHEVKTWEGKL